MLTRTSPAATEVLSSRAEPPVVASAIPLESRRPAKEADTSRVDPADMGNWITGVSVPMVGAEALLKSFTYFIDNVVLVRTQVPIVPPLAFTEVALVLAAETSVK